MSRLSTVASLQILAVMLLFTQKPVQAGTITIDFETLPDGSPISDYTALTTQFLGLTFTNATVISAGITLNDLEFPPYSGTNVAFDDGGPISIAFDSPIFSLSGYFTYSLPIVLAGFDATNTQLASAVSTFSSNLALSGDSGSSPNELLQLSSDLGFSSVTITGGLTGGSFVVDNLTLTSGASVPESPPFTSVSLGIAVLLLAAYKNHTLKTVTDTSI